MSRQDNRQPRNKGGRNNHGKGFPKKKPSAPGGGAQNHKQLKKQTMSDLLKEDQIALELLEYQTKIAVEKGLKLEEIISAAIVNYGNESDPDLTDMRLTQFFAEKSDMKNMALTAKKILFAQIEKRYPFPMTESDIDASSWETEHFSKEEVKKFLMRVSKKVHSN